MFLGLKEAIKVEWHPLGGQDVIEATGISPAVLHLEQDTELPGEGHSEFRRLLDKSFTVACARETSQDHGGVHLGEGANLLGVNVRRGELVLSLGRPDHHPTRV